MKWLCVGLRGGRGAERFPSIGDARVRGTAIKKEMHLLQNINKIEREQERSHFYTPTTM